MALTVDHLKDDVFEYIKGVLFQYRHNTRGWKTRAIARGILKPWEPCKGIPDDLKEVSLDVVEMIVQGQGFLFMNVDRDTSSEPIDCPDEYGDPVSAAAEQAYRRGFYQGFYRCYVDGEGVDKERLEDFMFGELHEWRYRVSLSKAFYPPSLVDIPHRA